MDRKEIENALKSIYADDERVKKVVCVEVPYRYIKNNVLRTDELIKGYWITWANCNGVVIFNYAQKLSQKELAELKK